MLKTKNVNEIFFKEFNDEVLVRIKRSVSSDVCKYKKGEWSQCDQLTQVKIKKKMQICNAKTNNLNTKKRIGHSVNMNT